MIKMREESTSTLLPLVVPKNDGYSVRQGTCCAILHPAPAFECLDEHILVPRATTTGNVQAHMAVSPTMGKWLYLCQKQLKKSV